MSASSTIARYSNIFTKYCTEDLSVHELCVDDYDKGYYELLNSHFVAPKLSKEEFEKLVNEIRSETVPHVIVGITDLKEKKIRASGTVFLERKIIRGHSLAAHIEEIVVDASERKKGYGKMLLEILKEIAVHEKAYKIILDCSDDVVPFYEKIGFTSGGHCMKIYTNIESSHN